MADNIIHEHGDQLFRKVTVPASGALSGDPVLCGQRPGVALTDQDANGYATVKFNGSAQLSVKGTTGSDAAVTPGDLLYYVAANTPKLSKTTSGVRFGYAAEAIGSGSTATTTVDIGY
jgi:predicted RecA/RadA family phage recombinase